MIDYIKLLRVSQWSKNIFVFIPLVFSLHLFEYDYTAIAFLAAVYFCLASSMIYIYNDMIDAEKDKLHPQKKHRPVAGGVISKGKASAAALFLFIIILSSIFIFNMKFVLALFAYILLNISYSLLFKNIVIADILSIALGFMLRILGGAYVIDVHVSSWLVLTTLFLSLFLAVMKRKSESEIQNESIQTRSVLRDYSEGFINQISAVSAAGVIICYALYTVSDRTIAFFHTENLVYTTIFVVFGVFRYLYLVYSKSLGENINDILLRDKSMLLNNIMYSISAIIIIY